MALRSENLAAPPSNRRRLHMTAACGLLLLLLYTSEIQGAAIRKTTGGLPTAPAHPNEVGDQQVNGGLRRPEEMGTGPLRRVARDQSDEEYDEEDLSWPDDGEDEATSDAPEDSPDNKDLAEGGEEETSAGNIEGGEEEEDPSEGSEEKDDTEDATNSATAGDEDASVETVSGEGGTAKEEDDDDWLNYNWSNESEEEGGEGHSWESISEKHDENGEGEDASFKGAAEGSAEGEENVTTEESEDDMGDDDDPIANEISAEKWKSKSVVNGKTSSHEAEESSTEDAEGNSGASEGSHSEQEHETEQETEVDSDPELVAIVPVDSGGQVHNDTEETKESGEEAGSGTMEGVEDDWEVDKDEAVEAKVDGEKAENEDGGEKGLDKSGEENESGEEDEEASWEAGHGTLVDAGMVAGGKRCREGMGKEVGEEGGEDEWSEEDCQNALAKGKAQGTEEVEGVAVGEEGSGGPPDEGIVEEGSLEDPSEEWEDEDEEGSGDEDKAEGLGVTFIDGDEDKGKDSVEHGGEHGGEHAGGNEGKDDEEHSEKHDGGVVIGGHDEEKEGERQSEEEGEEEGRSITTESEEEGEAPEGSGGGEGDDEGSGEGRIKGSQLDVGIKSEGSGSIEEEGGEGKVDDSESEEEVTEPVPAVVHMVHLEHPRLHVHSEAEEAGGEEGEESEREETDDHGSHSGVSEKGVEKGLHSEEDETTEEGDVTVVHGSLYGEDGEDEGLHSGEAEEEEGSVTVSPGESEADDDDERSESEEEEGDHGVPYSGVDEVGKGAEEGEGDIANISSNVYKGIVGEAKPESTTTEEEGDVAVVHVPHSSFGEEEEDENRSNAVEESGMSSGVQPGEGGEKDDDEWLESEEKGVHGPHSEESEKAEEVPHTDGEEEDAGATEVISAEVGQGEDEDDVSDSEDKWYLRSEYDDLDFGDEDETVTPRKKTESEEDPFGLKMFPGLIANISGNVYKGIVGEAKPGSTTTQKVPPNTSEGRKTQNAVENPSKAGISVRKMKVVADLGAAPIPVNAEGGDLKTPVHEEASLEKGDDSSGGDDKVSDTLITWIALGVVAAVFFGVLGYVYVRGKKTSGKGVVKNGRGPGVDEEKATVAKDVEMSLLGDKAFPPANYYGDGDYQSVPLEPEEKDEEVGDYAGHEEEKKPTEVDCVAPSQSEPLSAEPPPPVEEAPPMVKVVATFTETPKPMTPVYLNGRGITSSPKGRDGVSNSR